MAWNWKIPTAMGNGITYERASLTFIDSVDAEKEKLSAIAESNWIELKLESALSTPARRQEQGMAMVL